MFLCKHMPTEDVEKIKGDVEAILGYDIEKAAAMRRTRRERDSVTQALAMAKISMSETRTGGGVVVCRLGWSRGRRDRPEESEQLTLKVCK